MPEQLASSTNLDPTLVAPSPHDVEMGERVGAVIDYFNSEFGLNIDNEGSMNTEPTQEQLTSLREWNESTSKDGIIMPDIDTFTAKMLLAKALMPQRDEEGHVQYLFGKGAGAELALQGQVNGRVKRQQAVPFRTHSDFEIYAAATDDYTSIAHSERFISVFGAQEIYPVAKTKGLAELPPDLLHDTTETVEMGGLTFLVPNLELQFVDKFEKANESKERELRGNTDAELLAATYELDATNVHDALDTYVITPELSKLQVPEEEARSTIEFMTRKVAEAKRRIKGDSPEATEADINAELGSDFILASHAKNRGVNIAEVVNLHTGELKDNSAETLIRAMRLRQAKAIEDLQAKHQAINEILQQAG